MEKHCNYCGTTKPHSDFNKNRGAKDGLQSRCRTCDNSTTKKYLATEHGRARKIIGQRKYLESENGRIKTHQATAAWKALNESDHRRRKFTMQAMPSWADKDAIVSIYLEASRRQLAGQDAQVDHIVPLRSRLVCGLHVPANLQIITKAENSRKGNRTWPDMPVQVP